MSNREQAVTARRDDQDMNQFASITDPAKYIDAMRLTAADMSWIFQTTMYGPESRENYDITPIIALLDDYERLLRFLQNDDKTLKMLQEAVFTYKETGAARKKSRPGPKVMAAYPYLRQATETYLMEHGEMPTQQDLADHLYCDVKTIRARAKEYFGGWNQMRTSLLDWYRSQRG